MDYEEDLSSSDEESSETGEVIMNHFHDDMDSINIASPPSSEDHHNSPQQQISMEETSSNVATTPLQESTLAQASESSKDLNNGIHRDTPSLSSTTPKPLNPLIPTLITSPLTASASPSKLLQLSPRAQYHPPNMHLNIDNLLHHGSERLASPSRALVNNIIHHLTPHHLSPRYQPVVSDVSTEDEDVSGMNMLNDDEEELNILIDHSTQQRVVPSKSKSPPPSHGFRGTSPTLKASSYSGNLSGDDEEDDDEEELEENIESDEEDEIIDINSPPEEDQVEGFNLSKEDLMDELNRSNARLAYAESKDEEDEEQSLMNIGETKRNRRRRRRSTSPLTGTISNITETVVTTPSNNRESESNFQTPGNAKTNFPSKEDEATYYKRKYLETCHDLQVLSESYAKYQKRSEELEEEYDAELERYENLLQKSDLKINILLEQVKRLKEEIEEKNSTHSLEIERMIHELKRSNESEKFSLDLIKDIESSNGVLEQKLSMIEKDYERKLKEESNKQKELQHSLDEMKLTAAETIEKLKSENSRLENDLSHLRTAFESVSQSSSEIARLNCVNDRLSKIVEEKDLELSQLKNLHEKKKMLFKKARESKAVMAAQPKKNDETWNTILNTCKSLSEGISACQHVVQNVASSLDTTGPPVVHSIQ
ncbi:hypothetical protein C9374_009217 [Naegleria lovaniensis]|uniref:Uncharacterized protein n=1 Tax=Naegleria lovaniensis TaxID=51637 RepID=A0AA88GIA8_NAELO|nr:uncharacterized protein C9374_009217 [Naegleria lovaniensis]KAG2377701.1 hypothetical protein C9374_009217 [Naegleria lovaniensis]